MWAKTRRQAGNRLGNGTGMSNRPQSFETINALEFGVGPRRGQLLPGNGHQFRPANKIQATQRERGCTCRDAVNHGLCDSSWRPWWAQRRSLGAKQRPASARGQTGRTWHKAAMVGASIANHDFSE